MCNGKLFLASLLLVCCRTPTTLDQGAFAPLHTEGSRIIDAEGRTVILRGLQHHALQDVRYQGRDVAPEDYSRIASWGFTTLRVAISWSRIEPVRGVYDPAAITEITEVLDAAHAAGLTVILEWHQDLYGKCTQPEGAAQAMNANGAPDWACAGVTFGAFAHLQQFDRFFRNEDGLLDAFIAAWTHVIATVSDHPAVIGYDVLNEPAGSGGSPAFERDALFPAYRRIVPALRAAGAKGLIFLDAPVFRNETLEMYTEPVTDLGADIVFAPHLYTSWVTLFLLKASPGQDQKQLDFDNASLQADALGLPLWNGEWGTNLLASTGLSDMQTHVELEDKARIGSSYWAFERAVAGQGDDSISGGQSLLAVDGTPRDDVLALLSRPYAVQTPGTLRLQLYDFALKRLTLQLDATALKAPLVIYAPGLCFDVGGADTWESDQDGTFIRLRFTRAGSYNVTVQACPPKRRF